ncbi:MAG: hypothetical protein VX600_00385, partial [Candidatus Neomarinimicrobiota bacterium]|nr:hypothetical protein [Candidatus Neomarinimicrobiota bacterium]
MNFKIQKNLSYIGLACFLTGIICWYSFLQLDISKRLSEAVSKQDSMIARKKELDRMQKILPSVKNKFDKSNDDFSTLLKRIPLLSELDEALFSFRELLLSQSLEIHRFYPAQSSIEEQTIYIPETGENVKISKHGVDVIITGDFLRFANLLDYIQKKGMLINITGLGVTNSVKKNITFLAYVYFQEGNTNPDLIGSILEFQETRDQPDMDSSSDSIYIGGITRISWKGEEVLVGIDNPQYTSEGIEIYSIEYTDGRKEFVERSKLPPEIFDDSESNNESTGNSGIKSKQDVLQLKTQFSDQLVQLEERIKGFKSDQDEQQKKHEQKLQKVEKEYKKQLDSIQDEFEKQLVRQEKKISAFEEQEKLKEELKNMDKSKLERESKAKLESLQYEFDSQLRKLQAKISSFESMQQMQQEEFDQQKMTSERQNRAKLKALQEEFEGQLRQQQEKISAFESMQAQQKKEKQNQEETNKENQRQLNEMQREFEGQLRQQQEKISAFESMQVRQKQEMAEQKLLAKQANKEKLAEIQREFVD